MKPEHPPVFPRRFPQSHTLKLKSTRKTLGPNGEKTATSGNPQHRICKVGGFCSHLTSIVKKCLTLSADYASGTTISGPGLPAAGIGITAGSSDLTRARADLRILYRLLLSELRQWSQHGGQRTPKPSYWALTPSPVSL